MRIQHHAFLLAFATAAFGAKPVPVAWDEAALANWATPVAGLNQRPTHMSAKDYYAWPIDNLRTYPVYYPGREPAGYWEMLQRVGPKPLIQPERLKTEADWIEAGRRVFDELDHIPLRTFDPKFITAARSRETFDSAKIEPLPDGAIFGMRWTPTAKGVALSYSNCTNCHLRYMRDGTRVPGAPTLASLPRRVPALILEAHVANRRPPAAVPLRMPDEPFGMWLFRGSQVPWLTNDPNERLKNLSVEDFRQYARMFGQGGAVIRWNGSSLFPSKVPDLIGIKDRKYLDATGTHLHRGIGDLMRYAALVSYAEAVDFGPYHFLPTQGERLGTRVPDEALYAMAMYIYSLEPPRNPNAVNDKAKAGQKIFAREGCVACHTPPLYMNNKLTLAKGFTPPADKAEDLDLLPVSVGTDPSLALKTRKGTGYYKVPSLKGVWYRGHYLHDGSAASLEEMFDPDRVKDTHVPGGWSPPGTKSRSIKGHEFGLKLNQIEREQLIAFLRTL